MPDLKGSSYEQAWHPASVAGSAHIDFYVATIVHNKTIYIIILQ